MLASSIKNHWNWLQIEFVTIYFSRNKLNSIQMKHRWELIIIAWKLKLFIYFFFLQWKITVNTASWWANTTPMHFLSVTILVLFSKPFLSEWGDLIAFFHSFKKHNQIILWYRFFLFSYFFLYVLSSTVQYLKLELVFKPVIRNKKKDSVIYY